VLMMMLAGENPREQPAGKGDSRGDQGLVQGTQIRVAAFRHEKEDAFAVCGRGPLQFRDDCIGGRLGKIHRTSIVWHHGPMDAL